ncbi:MAG: hypothetical protein AAGA48_14205 [Myxococcota bacterium]
MAWMLWWGWFGCATSVLEADVLSIPYEARVQAEFLEELAESDIITEAQSHEGLQQVLGRVSQDVGRPVARPDLERVSSPAGQLTPLQRAAGFLTLTHVLMVLAAGVGVICASIIAMRLPRWGWLALLYGGATVLTLGAGGLPRSIQPFVALAGCLLFAAGLTVSARLDDDDPGPVNFGLLTVVSAVVAIAYQTPVVGFLAVISAMCTLGFGVWFSPLMVAIGFKDRADVERGTAAAFAVLGAYVVLEIAGLTALPPVEVFRPGALWMGSFVGYIGLLLLSSRWLKFPGYWLLNGVTLLAGMGALAVGSLFGISELLEIGGTFFVLWIIEKFLEIPQRDMVGYAAQGLAVSVVVFVAAMWARTHTDVLGPYLIGF